MPYIFPFYKAIQLYYVLFSKNPQRDIFNFFLYIRKVLENNFLQIAAFYPFRYDKTGIVYDYD